MTPDQALVLLYLNIDGYKPGECMSGVLISRGLMLQDKVLTPAGVTAAEELISSSDRVLALVPAEEYA